MTNKLEAPSIQHMILDEIIDFDQFKTRDEAEEALYRAAQSDATLLSDQTNELLLYKHGRNFFYEYTLHEKHNVILYGKNTVTIIGTFHMHLLGREMYVNTSAGRNFLQRLLVRDLFISSYAAVEFLGNHDFLTAFLQALNSDYWVYAPIVREYNTHMQQTVVAILRQILETKYDLRIQDNIL